MNPEQDEDVTTTLKSGKLGEDFYGYNHPNKFTGGFDEDGNYTGKGRGGNSYGGYGDRYKGGYTTGRGYGSGGYRGYGYRAYNDNYYNGFKAHDP